ncbi:hypothetical protein [Ferruginibacter profundus]
MKYAILIIIFCTCVYGSCSKNDDVAAAPASVTGYWKGSTNTYGIGTIVRTNGTARQLFNTGSLTLGDTTGSSVFKEEGTYTIIADSIFINTASVQLKGKMNAGFSNMQGASRISGGGLIINQTFTMTK